jgi:hypothetical protein
VVTHPLTSGLSVAEVDARTGLETLPRAHIEICDGDVRRRASPRDTMTEEATMHIITATPVSSFDDVAESHRSHHNDKTDSPTDTAAAQSTTIAPGRHVRARDLHPGDIMQQRDWSLHVREVKIGPAVIAATVTEFGFELHYAAEEMLRVA